ncbi:unnamed protein product [Dracunculus medinensis]|uniref:Glucosylceramidase n=1 Tax=Dracunculus medinensis TaxID=318479 RepID=A0A0N4UDD2_DRAME|nr:unnamed protein product [Dracunculus medinensis]
MKAILIMISTLFLFKVNSDKPCILKQYEGREKFVCVCNATYCDEIDEINDLKPFEAIIYESSESGKRFQKTTTGFTNYSKYANKSQQRRIVVNEKQKFQKIFGFGGAFTDASGINLNSLSEKTREALIRSYFSDTGLQYSLGRVPIASCDFSTHVYSYDDIADDFGLKNFSLTDEDRKLKVKLLKFKDNLEKKQMIPFIQQALNFTNGQMKIFASPWSAPFWMKSTNSMAGGGTLKVNNNESYHVTWANYFIKFIEEYKKANINIWGITVQNEPTTGVALDYKFQTMYFNPLTERDFIKKHLGPTFKKSPVAKDVKIIIMDDQRIQLPQWPDQVLRDAETEKYVSGIGVHWYLNFVSAKRLSETHNRHPNKFILATEACAGFIMPNKGPFMGDWDRAIHYTHDIIDDLANWVVGWTDWNLCLDVNGGPNWVENFVDSPIIVNATLDEFYKQPMFYAMGHFSKFVRPGSFRIESIIKDPSVPFEAIAFVTPKSQTVLIMNNPDFEQTFMLTIEDKSIKDKFLDIILKPRTLMSIVWKK